MSVGLYDSQIYGSLFGDDEAASLFADEVRVRAMLGVEAALARVQGRLGIIPAEAAASIAVAAGHLHVDLNRLGRGTEQAGVPVVELIAQLRQAVGGKAAQYVHWGATSQDVVDTAMVLGMRAVLELLEQRLDGLIDNLATFAGDHRHTLMAARTHGQQALPITLGLKAAGWLAPLIRHRARLKELRPRLLTVQLGGAAGTLAALDDQGLAVMEGVAQELKLAIPLLPWHSQRDAIAELGNWLSLLSGSLGKIGQDLILLSQSEVAELCEGGEGHGASSTMPQKRNPILAEMLVMAARHNASMVGSLHQALIAEHERATHGWQLEWVTLPPMVVTTAASLRHTRFIIDHLQVDSERMMANLAAANGMILAEAATFALARHMPRPEADKLVKDACAQASSQGKHLFWVLKSATKAPVDWDNLADPRRYLGVSEALLQRVLDASRRVIATDD